MSKHIYAAECWEESWKTKGSFYLDDDLCDCLFKNVARLKKLFPTLYKLTLDSYGDCKIEGRKTNSLQKEIRYILRQKLSNEFKVELMKFLQFINENIAKKLNFYAIAD